MVTELWSKEFLEEIANERGLTTPQKQVFFLRFWHEMDYGDIAKKLNAETSKNIHESAYRKRMGTIYDKFEIKGEKKGKEEELRQLLKEEYQKRGTSTIGLNSSVSLSHQELVNYPKGPLRLDSPYYINRPLIEEKSYQAILIPGNILNILGDRKTGKTSLVNRVVNFAEDQNYKIVHINLELADLNTFSHLNDLLIWFCNVIYKELNLNPESVPKLKDFWDEDFNGKINCKYYFDEHILKNIDTSLLLVMDNIDLILPNTNQKEDKEKIEIAIEFMTLLRYFFEQGKQEELWEKLKMVLARSRGDRDLYRYFPSISSSPFNVGTSPNNMGTLTESLPYFTEEQIRDLGERYGLNWSQSELTPIELINATEQGHPYCVHLLIYKITQQQKDLQTALNDNDLKIELENLKKQMKDKDTTKSSGLKKTNNNVVKLPQTKINNESKIN